MDACALDPHGQTNENGKPQSKPREDVWYTKRLERTFERRLKQGLAIKDSQSPEHLRGQRAIVHEDDVCIHVIGLCANLTPEKAFEGVYGLTRPPRAWWIPNTEFELFVADSQFYHRDQLVPTEAPLEGLGVNYHGDLRLTADRTEIVRDPVLFGRYKTKLGQALDIAIQNFPDLANQVMCFFLTARGRHHPPQPPDTAHADQYRAAFTAVCHARCPNLFSAGEEVYPYSRRRGAEDMPILTQLDLVPWPVDDWQLDVLEASGAYISPSDFAERFFLQSGGMPEAELYGVDLFRQCVSQIFPGRGLAISIRKYPHAQPRCVVRGEQIFLAGPPPCNICPADRCHCWIGPALIRVARSCTNGKEPDLEKIFQIYDEGQGLYGARRMRFSIMHDTDATEAEPDQQCHSECDTELESNASSVGPEIKMTSLSTPKGKQDTIDVSSGTVDQQTQTIQKGQPFSSNPAPTKREHKPDWPGLGEIVNKVANPTEIYECLRCRAPDGTSPARLMFLTCLFFHYGGPYAFAETGAALSVSYQPENNDITTVGGTIRALVSRKLTNTIERRAFLVRLCKDRFERQEMWERQKRPRRRRPHQPSNRRKATNQADIRALRGMMACAYPSLNLKSAEYCIYKKALQTTMNEGTNWFKAQQRRPSITWMFPRNMSEKK